MSTNTTVLVLTSGDGSGAVRILVELPLKDVAAIVAHVQTEGIVRAAQITQLLRDNAILITSAKIENNFCCAPMLVVLGGCETGLFCIRIPGQRGKVYSRDDLIDFDSISFGGISCATDACGERNNQCGLNHE